MPDAPAGSVLHRNGSFTLGELVSDEFHGNTSVREVDHEHQDETDQAQAAALMHSLALNHPFVDGNNRVAAVAAIIFIESNAHEFLATPDELVETTIAVAEGAMAVDALAIWFRQRVRSSE